MKYVTRHEQVDAFCTTLPVEQWPEWAGQALKDGHLYAPTEGWPGRVQTSWGYMDIPAGGWIVRTHTGDFYAQHALLFHERFVELSRD